MLPPEAAADVVPYTTDPFRECTDANPCHFAHWAVILLNPDFADEDMVGNEAFRHVLFTHELGHVVGQGHTGFFPACGDVPYTIMFMPGFCWDFWDLHWVRPNDVLFSNVKY